MLEGASEETGLGACRHALRVLLHIMAKKNHGARHWSCGKLLFAEGTECSAARLLVQAACLHLIGELWKCYFFGLFRHFGA
jgi:hypothetical protein